MKGHLIFNNVYLGLSSVVVGPLEKKGPLGKYFDESINDYLSGEDSFEKTEVAMLKKAIKLTLLKEGLTINDLDCVIGGDLLNQIAASNYTYKEYPVPFLGVYSACATFIEGLIVGSMAMGCNLNKILVSTSSHNLTAERQFRNPAEYGGAKAITTTFTVTASVTQIIKSENTGLKLSEVTIGRVMDFDFYNQFDMGSIMAPSALDSLFRHFAYFKTKPDDYDLILTGDLSEVGFKIVKEGLEEQFGTINNYNDCGRLIFDDPKLTFCGGSGPGCMASVFTGYIKKLIEDGVYKKVLLCGTGALINTTMNLQKEPIPSISHIVVVEGGIK